MKSRTINLRASSRKLFNNFLWIFYVMEHAYPFVKSKIITMLGRYCRC